MLNTIRTCLKKNIKKGSKNFRFNKSESKNPTLKTLPVFQYPVSKEGDHRVYVWGLAQHGGLGTMKSARILNGVAYISKPKRLFFGEQFDVTDIACGYGFTAFAVSSKNKNILYGSGLNTDSQLGYDESDEKNFPDDVIHNPRQIDLPLKDTSTKVLDIAAGRAHLLVLTTEGLFTLGNNAYGQCGRPIISGEDYRKSKVIHHIPDIKGKKIKAVTAGQDHRYVTESGEVYTFGWGADGQTGLAHYQNEYRPSLVKGDLAGQHIIKVACVADCVLALSDKGKVFGWGNSEYEQLHSMGDNRQVNIATELSICKELGYITDIASGGCFCMVLNNTGSVYVWGYGILGLGPHVQQASKPTLVPPTLFGNNAYEPNTKVIKIFCGMSHLAALTNVGNLYTWGCNKFGSLGLGHSKDQFFPLRVNVAAQVKKVACGIDHTVTLCKPFV